MKYYNNDFLSFLNIVVDFVYFLAKIKNLQKFYYTNSIGEKEYFDLSLEFGRNIMKIIYDNISIGKILLYNDVDIYEFTFNPISFSIDKFSTDIDKELEKFNDYYSNSIMINANVDKFFKSKENFLIHHSAIKTKKVFDIDKKELDGYINSYKKLLDYFQHYDMNNLNYNIIKKIIHLDSKNDASGNLVYKLCSPICLSKIFRIYDELLKYYEKICKLKFNESIHIIYKNMLIQQIRESFRWNVINEKNELCSSLLTSGGDLKVIPSKRKLTYLDINNLVEIMSIEVKKSIASNKEKIVFSFVGDCSYLFSIEELYECLIKKNLQYCINIPVEFHLYGNRSNFILDKYENVIKEYNSEWLLYDNRVLEQINNTSNSLFILDSELIYKTTYMPPYNPEFYEQHIMYNDWRQTLIERYNSINLSLYSNFSLVKPHYTLDEILFNCLSNMSIPVHMFMNNNVEFSDFKTKISNFNIDKCFDKNAIHMYSMPNLKFGQIEEGTDKICFLIYDFYRFIIFNDDYFKDFFELNSAFLNTKICIDYTEPFELLCLYENCNDVDSEVLRKWLTDNFLLLFNNRSDECYMESEALCYQFEYNLKTAISNFIYNISNNLNNMLFFHIFDKHMLKITDIKETNFDMETSANDFFCCFAHKGLYEYYFDSFDIISNEYIGQHLCKEIMDKIDLNFRQQVNDKVLKKCRQYKYSDSYLYKHLESQDI